MIKDKYKTMLIPVLIALNTVMAANLNAAEHNRAANLYTLPEQISTFNFKTTIRTQLPCRRNCGNCCTSRTATDSRSIKTSIGSSDVALDDYANDDSSHWIRGYYYKSSGSVTIALIASYCFCR